jgi:AcrR family transcriptional regulator
VVAKGALMPRTADQHLEKRILDAAYKLWSKGGAAALTMRDVAAAAGTTTPTVYQRFRSKDDLIRSLRERVRLKLLSTIQHSSSVLEACRRGLDFTLTHREEYLLDISDWAVRLEGTEPLPAFDFLRKLLARELGGTPAQHTKLAIAIVELFHGTATLLLAKGVSSQVRKRLRRACLSACKSLIQSAPRSGLRARQT